MKKKHEKADIDPKYEFMNFMNGRVKELPTKHKGVAVTDPAAVIQCRKLAREAAAKELSDPFVYRRQLSRYLSGADDYREGSRR